MKINFAFSPNPNCSGMAAMFLTSVFAMLLSGCAHIGSSDATARHLADALTFHAGFDGSTDAAFARGDRRLYSAPNMKHPRVGQPGLPASGVVSIASGQGRFGDALRFHQKASEMVFYQALDNMAYRSNQWSGSVSLWLRVNPAAELAPGFCDPIQITPRDWNDAAFFVEFEKKTNSIPFRLGAYADFKVWNPQNRDWGKIPMEEKPLVHIENPPFDGQRWTHVVFTFENFNTGRPDGVAKLYLDGKLSGHVSPRVQTFTWDPSKTLIMLGLSYAGLYDELAIFDRALTAAEIAALHGLKDGVRSLHR